MSASTETDQDLSRPRRARFSGRPGKVSRLQRPVVRSFGDQPLPVRASHVTSPLPFDLCCECLVARLAPDAIQVADRFHLLQGLTDALEKVFRHHRSALRAAVVEDAPPVEQEEETYRGKREVSHTGPQQAEAVSQERQGEKVARAQQVRTLYELGVGITEIARQVGVSRKTVYAYLRQGGPPERKRPRRNPGERVIAPYETYLLQRWNEGCHNGMQLWREIQAQGYTFSRASVTRSRSVGRGTLIADSVTLTRLRPDRGAPSRGNRPSRPSSA